MTDRHRETATAVTESTTVVIQAVKLPAIFLSVILGTAWAMNKYNEIGNLMDEDNRKLMLLIEANQRAISANQQAIVITQAQADKSSADILHARDFDTWLQLFRAANHELMIRVPDRYGSSKE